MIEAYSASALPARLFGLFTFTGRPLHLNDDLENSKFLMLSSGLLIKNSTADNSFITYSSIENLPGKHVLRLHDFMHIYAILSMLHAPWKPITTLQISLVSGHCPRAPGLSHRPQAFGHFKRAIWYNAGSLQWVTKSNRSQIAFAAPSEMPILEMINFLW